MSDRNCMRAAAPQDSPTAIPVSDWISNEPPVRIVALRGRPDGQLAARHQLDLDGPLVQIALTKEP